MKILYSVSLMLSFCISSFAQTQSIDVEPGWNLISLPVHAAGSVKSALFPTAVSSAFIYENGYLAKDTLNSGYGFWLKYDSAETVFISGDTIFADSIDVHAGWNIIGSLTAPISEGSIKSDPPGIIVSRFFSYTNGAYQSTNTLQPGFGYWVKVNQDGLLILYPQTCPGIPTVPYEGKTYNTVLIGDQCWLRENLDVGTMIQGSDTSKDNSIIEKYCYGSDTNNCTIYGGLYKWDEAMQYRTGDSTQGICPSGWHIPTIAQYQILGAAVSGDGNALKAVGQGVPGYGVGTDVSRFAGLLAGFKGNVSFNGLSGLSYFWSSTEVDGGDSWGMFIYYDNGNIDFGNGPREFGYSVRCVLDNSVNSPPNTPFSPNPIDGAEDQSTSTTLRWQCFDPENDTVTYDVCFDIDNPPVTVVTSDQTDPSLVRNNLMDGTTYYWKVVAKDNHGNSTDSPVWSFTTSVFTCGDSISFEDKTYTTVQIGNQCWVKENLDVGTRIDGTQEQSNNSTIEKYCYNNDPAYCMNYGGLYQWNEAMQYSTTEGSQGICPNGWHVPTSDEFNTLHTMVGGDGNALKEIGQGTGAGAGTNTSGFSALLAGFRGSDGGFNFVTINAHFWGSTEYDSGNANLMGLLYSDSHIYAHNYFKEYGFSVRCVKN